MVPPSNDHSVFDEPHLTGEKFSNDPTESKAQRELESEKQTLEQQVDQSVWDEPGISPTLSGEIPQDEITYQKWLRLKEVSTSTGKTWLFAILFAFIAGPWALLGSIWGSGQSFFSAMLVIFFGPAVEEMMKIGTALLVVEKKPYLFKSPFQILICVLAGAVCFSVVENLLYLNIYIKDPSNSIIAWRWSVCVALHTGCSFFASLGLLKIWKTTQKHKTRPKVSLAFPYIVTAVIIHGSYNFLALILEVAGVFR